jgi:hypothetical protein
MNLSEPLTEQQQLPESKHDQNPDSKAVGSVASRSEVEIIGPAELAVMLGDGFAAWECRILCEDAPLTVHYLSRLRGRVPQHAIPGFAVRLLDLNRRIRFGQFSLDSKRGTVTYRLTQHIYPQLPLNFQFCEALSNSHREMTTLGRIVMRFLGGDAPCFAYNFTAN